MTNRRIERTVAAFCASLMAVNAAYGLDLGDTAPPLTIGEWVQGKAVDVTKRDQLYLVEFWAAWCPPCKMTVPLLTDLQKKHKGKLTIIGVTAPDGGRNSAKAVRQFVKSQGKKMDYHVALDKNEASTNAYMRTSNVLGIPFAFLVGRDGKIAWMGSPMDRTMGVVIEQVISGEYDPRKAQIQARIDGLMQGVFGALQTGQAETAWKYLIDALELDPANGDALDIMTRIYTDQLRDPKVFRSWASAHLAAHRDDAVVMYSLSNALCSISDLSLRLPDIAVEAAKAAYTASGAHDPIAIATYARALFNIGKLDRAISLQEQAVAAADGENRVFIQGVLDHYNQCKQLQATVN